MNPPQIPIEASERLCTKFSGYPWFCGVTVSGMGPDAVLEIRTTDLVEAQSMIIAMGYRSDGYRVIPRLVVES